MADDIDLILEQARRLSATAEGLAPKPVRELRASQYASRIPSATPTVQEMREVQELIARGQAVQPRKDRYEQPLSEVLTDIAEGPFGGEYERNLTRVYDVATRPSSEYGQPFTSAQSVSEFIAERYPGRPEGSLANIGTEVALGAIEPGPDEFITAARAFFGVPVSLIAKVAGGAVEDLSRMFRGQAIRQSDFDWDVLTRRRANLYGGGMYTTTSTRVAGEYAVSPDVLENVDDPARNAWAAIVNPEQKRKWHRSIERATDAFGIPETAMAPHVQAFGMRLVNPLDMRAPATRESGELIRDFMSNPETLSVWESIGREDLPSIIEVGTNGLQNNIRAIRSSVPRMVGEEIGSSVSTAAREEVSRLADSFDSFLDDIDFTPDNIPAIFDEYQRTYLQTVDTVRQDLLSQGVPEAQLEEVISRIASEDMRNFFSMDAIYSDFLQDGFASKKGPDLAAGEEGPDQENLGDLFNDFVRSQGYDGIYHYGGTRMGQEAHDVALAFGEENVLETYEDFFNLMYERADDITFSNEDIESLTTMFPSLSDDAFYRVDGGFALDKDSEIVADVLAEVSETQASRAPNPSPLSPEADDPVYEMLDMLGGRVDVHGTEGMELPDDWFDDFDF